MGDYGGGGDDNFTVATAPVLSSTTACVAAATGVAAAPSKDETLYEQMVRYQNEHESYTSDESDGARARRRRREARQGKIPPDESSPPVILEDDRKPPPSSSMQKKPPPQNNANTDSNNRPSSSPPVSTDRKLAPKNEDNSKKPQNPKTIQHQANSSFYQAALEELRSQQEAEDRNRAPPHSNSEESPMQKPGIVQVNEPAVRPDSHLYRLHYGDPNANRPKPSKSFDRPMNIDEVRNTVAAMQASRADSRRHLDQANSSRTLDQIEIDEECDESDQLEPKQYPYHTPKPLIPASTASMGGGTTGIRSQRTAPNRSASTGSSGVTNLPPLNMLMEPGSKQSIRYAYNRSRPNSRSSSPVVVRNNPTSRDMSPVPNRGLVAGNQYARGMPPVASYGMKGPPPRTFSGGGGPMNHNLPRGGDPPPPQQQQQQQYPSPPHRNPMQQQYPSPPHRNPMQQHIRSSYNQQVTPFDQQPSPPQGRPVSHNPSYKNHQQYQQPRPRNNVGSPRSIGGPTSYAQQPNKAPPYNNIQPLQFQRPTGYGESRNNGPLPRNSSNPNLMESSTTNPEMRRSPAPPPTSSTPRTASTADEDDDYSETDEDLRLALEISKMDTGGVGGNGGSSPSKKLPGGGQPEKKAELCRTSSLSQEELLAARNLMNAPEMHSSFGIDAIHRRNDPEISSLADVLLALKLSAEESGDGNLHRNSTSIDELLALEKAQASRGTEANKSGLSIRNSVMDMVAAGISTTPTGLRTPTESTSNGEQAEQMRILQQIREEQEQKELELALKVSQQQETAAASGGVGSRAGDFLLSQQEAMKEWSNRNISSAPGQLPQRPLPGVSRKDSIGRRQELLERGTEETKDAIHSGQSQIVKCRGCGGRLQAPLSYSLVFCPKCQTISPA